MRAIHRHRNWNNATMKAATFAFDKKLGGGNILLWGLGSGQRSYFDQWNNAVYRNWLETDPALRGDMAQYSQTADPNVATAIPENFGGAMVYVDPVLVAHPEYAPYVQPTNLAQVEAQAQAQAWAADQARLAAEQAAAAEAARIAQLEAEQQARVEQAAKYEAQFQAESLAAQAEAARLRALQAAADANATAAQIAHMQAEALRIAQEAKAAAEAYAAQQEALRKAQEAAAKAAAEYAASLVDKNTPKTTILSDSSQVFIAGGVAAVGILALLFS